MPRLPIALAFLAGLACATLFGAAAPRPAPRPIEWQYRLLDDGEITTELCKREAKLVQETRSKFESDAAALDEASRIVASEWTSKQAADGWFWSDIVEVNGERFRLMARPVGRSVTVRQDAIGSSEMDEELRAQRTDWEKRFGHRGVDGDGRNWGEFERAELDRRYRSAIERAGRSGELLIRDMRRPAELNFFGVTISP